MPWHPLDDARETVAHAHQLLDSLTDEVAVWADRDENKLHVKDRADVGGYRIMEIDAIPALPQSWGNQVTNIANSARSALDYTISTLAVANGSDPEKHKTAFPIAITRDDYWKSKPRRVPYRSKAMVGVPEEWMRKVDAVQPFESKNPRMHPLARLNRLTNRGKHRTRNVPYALVETPWHQVTFETRDDVGGLEVRYRGTDIDVTAKLLAPGVGGEMGIRVYHKTVADGNVGNPGIAFGPDRIVVPDMELMIEYVGGIVTSVEPAFP